MNRPRIRRISIVIALGVMFYLTPTAICVARADDTDKQHREIAEIYKRLEAAFKARDAKAMVAVCADNYQVEFPNGRKMDRSQYASNYARQMSAIQAVHSIHIEPSQFVGRNNETVVSVTSSLTARTIDALKASHEINSVVHARDTWAKNDKSWRLVSSQVLQQSLTQDGKTILFQAANSAKSHG